MNWMRITTDSGMAVAGRNSTMNSRVWKSPVAAASRKVGKRAAKVGMRKPSEKIRSTGGACPAPRRGPARTPREWRAPASAAARTPSPDPGVEDRHPEIGALRTRWRKLPGPKRRRRRERVRRRSGLVGLERRRQEVVQRDGEQDARTPSTRMCAGSQDFP